MPTRSMLAVYGMRRLLPRRAVEGALVPPAAATDGGLGHDCDCDKEDCDPAVGVHNRRKASLIQGPGPSGAAARGAPVVTTIRNEPIAHNAGTKPVISLAQRKQNLREGKG